MFQLIYITCTDESEAKKIASELLQANLIACGNILPPIVSCFDWKGQVQEQREVILLAKSQAHLFEDIVDMVTSYHSYECPCILALDVRQGHSPFLDWIAGETGSPPG